MVVVVMQQHQQVQEHQRVLQHLVEQQQTCWLVLAQVQTSLQLWGHVTQALKASSTKVAAGVNECAGCPAIRMSMMEAEDDPEDFLNVFEQSTHAAQEAVGGNPDPLFSRPSAAGSGYPGPKVGHQ